MNKVNFEEISANMNKLSQSAYSAGKAFYTLNTDTLEQLFDQQLAITTLGMNAYTRQLALIGKAKGYQAIVEGQAEIANDISGKTQGIARNTLDILNESKDEVTAWAENAAKEVAANIPAVKAA